MPVAKWVGLFEDFERDFQIKSIHNELKIIFLLNEVGPLPSLELYRKSKRSISGHNADLKRLRGLGIIDCMTGAHDRREKIYDLAPSFRERFQRFVEQYWLSTNDEAAAEGNVRVAPNRASKDRAKPRMSRRLVRQTPGSL